MYSQSLIEKNLWIDCRLMCFVIIWLKKPCVCFMLIRDYYHIFTGLFSQDNLLVSFFRTVDCWTMRKIIQKPHKFLCVCVFNDKPFNMVLHLP